MSQPLGGNMSKRRRTEEKKIDVGVGRRGEQREAVSPWETERVASIPEWETHWIWLPLSLWQVIRFLSLYPPCTSATKPTLSVQQHSLTRASFKGRREGNIARKGMCLSGRVNTWLLCCLKWEGIGVFLWSEEWHAGFHWQQPPLTTVWRELRRELGQPGFSREA